MENIRKYLLEKGWKRKDIESAIKIIRHAKKHKHPKIKLLDKAVYWISLAVAIAGNFIISIALMPFLLALNGFHLFLFIIALGASFGLLFELLVRGIEGLEAKHHLFLGIIIPIVALVSFVIISDNLKRLIGVESPHDPIIVGAVYGTSFILPYITYHIFLKQQNSAYLR